MAINVNIWSQAIREGLNNTMADNAYEGAGTSYVVGAGGMGSYAGGGGGANVSYGWITVGGGGGGYTTYPIAAPAMDARDTIIYQPSAMPTEAEHKRAELVDYCKEHNLDPHFVRELDLD